MPDTSSWLPTRWWMAGGEPVEVDWIHSGLHGWWAGVADQFYWVRLIEPITAEEMLYGPMIDRELKLLKSKGLA